MLDYILHPLGEAIKALPFIDLFGGLILSVTRNDENRNGEIYQRTLPLSCSSNELQCESEDLFRIITPNDEYRSVCYFEPDGMLETSYSTVGRVKNVLHAAGDCKFVLWLNLQKLGELIYYRTATEYFFHVRKMLSIPCNTFKHPDYNITFTIKNDLTGSSNPFEKWDFDVDQQSLIFEPFAHIYLTLHFEAYVSLNTLLAYDPKDSFSCYPNIETT